MNTPYFDDSQWLKIIDQLAEKDFCVVDNFFRISDYEKLKDFFQNIYAEALLTPAKIGADQNALLVQEIRGDYTYWLDRKRDLQLQFFFDFAFEMISQINRNCFLSLSDFEFHIAEYPSGAFYKKHLDQFKGRSNRLITFLVYFNDQWQEGDGGELAIYNSDDKYLKFAPLGNRVILFKSDVVMHEVLVANKPRRSLTGWLLYAPQGLGALMG